MQLFFFFFLLHLVQAMHRSANFRHILKALLYINLKYHFLQTGIPSTREIIYSE